MESFKEFINEDASVNAGAFQNTGTTGYDAQFWGIGHSLDLPTPTLDMPTRTLQGNVRRIVYTENPISVQLDTGAIWHLTKEQWDYLKSTNKEPKINSNIQIEMYLDGTIKSVVINHRSMGITEKRANFGGRENNTMMGKPARGKAEKLFGKKNMPF